MLSISKLLPQGRGLSGVLLRRAPTIELDWDVRQKSRFDAVDSSGRTLGVFLARGTVVRGGDVLVTEDGSLVVVRAQPQRVMVVRPCAEHGSPFDLLRAAYHLGNRHVQLELAADHLKLEPDHVLGAMLERMHLIVSEEMAAFEPEAGAYAADTPGHAHGSSGSSGSHADRHGDGGHDGHSHGSHDHHHDHDHDRAHGHGHSHAHNHAQDPSPQDYRGDRDATDPNDERLSADDAAGGPRA